MTRSLHSACQRLPLHHVPRPYAHHSSRCSWEDDAVVTGGSSDDGAPPTTPTTPVGLLRQGSLPQTQSYVYKHAGLTVKLGLQEVASDLYRVKPHVYCAPDNAAAIVFSGACMPIPAGVPKRRTRRTQQAQAPSSDVCTPHVQPEPSTHVACS